MSLFHDSLRAFAAGVAVCCIVYAATALPAETGASIDNFTFKPDTTIMDASEFNFDTLATRLRQLAFLNRGLKITLSDERGEDVRTEEFFYSGDRKSVV